MIKIPNLIRNQLLTKALKIHSRQRNQRSLLLWKQTYSYISPIDKPVLSLALTSFHQMSGQFMSYMFYQSGGMVSPEFSIVLGAIAFRIGLQGFSSIMKAYNYNNRNNLKTRDYVSQRSMQNDRIMVKLIDKVLILDTVRDLQFYGVVSKDINRAIWMYYRPGVLISSAVNFYLCLNFLRGAHMVITNPDYSLFCDNTAYLASLAFHDPKYLTPIAIILLNFIILKKSRHPLFINLNHPGNVMHCFNIAFMSGLLFVPVPGIYHFAYMGLALGHIMLRSLRYAREDMFRSVKKIFK